MHPQRDFYSKLECDKTLKALFVIADPIDYELAKPLIARLMEKRWRVSVLKLDKTWHTLEWIFMHTLRSSKVRNYDIESLYKGQETVKYSNFYKYRIPKLIAKILAGIIRFLKTQNPNVLIYFRKNLLCEIVVLLGKQLKIPSLSLLHLGIIGTNYEKQIFFLADKIAVMGPYGKQILVERGVPEHKITVTGRTIYDTLKFTHYNKSEICRKLNLNPNEKIVVYVTENFPLNENQRNAYIVCQTLKQFPNVQLIIKVHAAERNLRIYYQILKHLELKAIINQKDSPFEFFSICDVLITGYSTAALDAMVMGKPAVTFNFTKYDSPIPYIEEGVTIGAFNKDDLSEALNEALYNEKAKEKLRKHWVKFIFEHAYKIDGKACERVVTLMESMCLERCRNDPCSKRKP